MRDRQSGGSADVFAGHPQPTVPRGVGGGGAGRHDVGAHTVDLEGGANFGDLVERFVGQFDLVEQVLGGADAVGQFGLGIPGGKSFGIVFEGDAAFDDLDPELAVTWRGNFDGESETVEELRAEFAFFGVHGADEGETCGVDNRGAAGQSLSRPLVIQLNVLVVCVLDPFIRVKRRRGGRLFGLVGKVDLARIVKVRLELSVHALTLRCRAGGHLRGRIGAANTKQWRCQSRRLIRWVRSPVLATLGADHYYDSHTTTNRPHPHRLVLRNHQTGVERQP